MHENVAEEDEENVERVSFACEVPEAENKGAGSVCNPTAIAHLSEGRSRVERRRGGEVEVEAHCGLVCVGTGESCDERFTGALCKGKGVCLGTLCFVVHGKTRRVVGGAVTCSRVGLGRDKVGCKVVCGCSKSSKSYGRRLENN